MDEQLEEIKIWVANFVGNEDTDYPTLRLDDYKYLIQQAEQVQALKEDNKRLKREIRGYSSQLFDLTSRS